MEALSADLLTWAVMALSATQTGLMLVDELVYHRRRGLGLWETVGHPTDTLLFLAALLVPALHAPTGAAQLGFAGLALGSMLIITKDEWVHARECEPAETWLHAVLFVLHAPVLIFVWLLWRAAPETPVIRLLPPMVGGWMVYQIAYWAAHHAKRHHQQRLLRRAG